MKFKKFEFSAKCLKCNSTNIMCDGNDSGCGLYCNDCGNGEYD